jgi:hypothetical protein
MTAMRPRLTAVKLDRASMINVGPITMGEGMFLGSISIAIDTISILLAGAAYLYNYVGLRVSTLLAVPAD